MDGSRIARVVDVVIAAACARARPLIAQERDEAARLVERLTLAHDLRPVFLADPEIVALPRGDVHPRLIAREAEILVHRARPDRGARLAVDVPPEERIGIIRSLGQNRRTQRYQPRRVL